VSATPATLDFRNVQFEGEIKDVMLAVIGGWPGISDFQLYDAMNRRGFDDVEEITGVLINLTCCPSSPREARPVESGDHNEYQECYYLQGMKPDAAELEADRFAARGADLEHPTTQMTARMQAQLAADKKQRRTKPQYLRDGRSSNARR
jgi:hypothetical protein